MTGMVMPTHAPGRDATRAQTPTSPGDGDRALTPDRARSLTSAPATRQTPPFPRPRPVAIVLVDDDRRGTHRRRQNHPVLDHRTLHRGHSCTPQWTLITTLPSPTPLNAPTTMTTVRPRELPQHPVEPI